jgi:hypothetical protein
MNETLLFESLPLPDLCPRRCSECDGHHHFTSPIRDEVIALADACGVDVEGFLRTLRAEEGKADELAPPGEPS